MEIFLLILRIALVGVFGVAGTAKAFDRVGSAKAFDGFGVPRPLSKILVYLLPALEIAVAISLLFIKTSWYGAIGASGLLLLFTIGMLYQFAKGNAPDCHCFGQIHSEPVGVSSIVRNMVLLIPAGILFVQGRQGQGLALDNSSQEVLILSVGVVLGGLLLLAILYLREQTMRQIEIMRRIELMEFVGGEGGEHEPVEREDIGHPREGLPFGALVPDFALPDMDGNVVTLADIRAEGLPVLFLSVGAGCVPCRVLRPEFDKWEEEFAGKVKFVFLSNGKPAENRKKFGTIEGRTVLLQEDREVVLQFRLKWTPMAVLMDRRGRIASFSGAGDMGLHELIEKIREGDLSNEYAYFPGKDTRTLVRVRIGEEAREFSTTDINGREFSSADLKGKQTLVAFWSPNCKYCVPMMKALKEWDATKNGVDPELVVFTDGDTDDHKPELKSPIVADLDSEIGISIGQLGTPSAILIDENGRFISETAVGADDIWALIGMEPTVNDG